MRLRWMLLCVLMGYSLTGIAQSLTHKLQVELRPDSGGMAVTDTVAVAEPVAQFEFVLNAGFSVETETGLLTPLQHSRDGTRIAYRVVPPQPTKELKLRFSGQPRFSGRRSMGGMPQGEVGTDGVYLDAASAWYPLFDGPVTAMTLDIDLPEGWESLGIGQRSDHGDRQRWVSTQPHDSLYLLAAPYRRYATQHDGVELSVWLLQDDTVLAQRYLDVMGDYLDHYSKLIGPYPYPKFAVVENRWQTGFGMPSFTLLGSQVIRLPFIPFTSLPHEILHNWWGNGVWVDYAQGNWSEGLTAYLADHWMQERRGKGHEYRLKALQRYSNFAANGNDAPLLDFVSRHNDASQSIGYSKSLMLFHKLRRELGDEAFVAGLRRLWGEHRFEHIGFEQAVKTLIGPHRDLQRRASTWLQREGAPRLKLDRVQTNRTASGYRLDFTLRQDEPAFRVRVPVAVTREGSPEAEWHWVELDDTSTDVSLALATQPLRVDVDPAYDVLRYLDVSEQPPALNRLLGGEGWLIVPTGDAETQEAWEGLIEQWRKRYPSLRSTTDRELNGLPIDADRIVLGWNNRLLEPAAAALRRTDQSLESVGATLGEDFYTSEEHSVVLVNNDATGRTTGFIGAATPKAISAMARKLPHYGSYGRLAFDAASGRNLRKDTLSSDHSSLSRQLVDRPIALRLPPSPVLGQTPSRPR
jgi:aminopeptidase N